MNLGSKKVKKNLKNVKNMTYEFEQHFQKKHYIGLVCWSEEAKKTAAFKLRRN